jgi:23S rRNA (adenine1618-N6)-methyltransferase
MKRKHLSTSKEKNIAKQDSCSGARHNARKPNNDNRDTQTIVDRVSSSGLHSRNKHLGRYDFAKLLTVTPELKAHIVLNPKGEESINFSMPESVKVLNKALLAYHYQVTNWDIPQGYLCPPIPGRADYIHRVADLLMGECKQLKSSLVRMLDVGVGANCVYPIVGAIDYGWQCVGSDIDPISVDNAKYIVTSNSCLKGKIDCRLQTSRTKMFKGIIKPSEFFDLTTCNPPFHKSSAEAERGSQRKLSNLNSHRAKRSVRVQAQGQSGTELNFGGQNNELWCSGGEERFIGNLALESRTFADQVLWFTTLVSKKENVRGLCRRVNKLGAIDIKVLEMSQGQKKSRVVAWTFKTEQQRQEWLSLKPR